MKKIIYQNDEGGIAIIVAGRLVITGGEANFTGTINISNTGTLATV